VVILLVVWVVKGTLFHPSTCTGEYQGKQKLLETNTRQSDWDTALVLFRQGEQLSERLKHQPLKEESQQLLAMTCLLKKDKPQSRAYFDKVILARRRAGDKAGEAVVILRMAAFTFRTAWSARTGRNY
jgi:hypothetical protein